MNAYLASIAVRPTELGGRHLAIGSGYVGDMLLAGRRVPVLVLWIGQREAAPGIIGLAVLAPRVPKRAEPAIGAEFVLPEGVREVAGGSIRVVLPQETHGELDLSLVHGPSEAQWANAKGSTATTMRSPAHDAVIEGVRLRD